MHQVLFKAKPKSKAKKQARAQEQEKEKEKDPIVQQPAATQPVTTPAAKPSSPGQGAAPVKPSGIWSTK